MTLQTDYNIQLISKICINKRDEQITIIRIKKIEEEEEEKCIYKVFFK